MNDKLGTRRVFLPQGRTPLETLVDAIATSPADLFDQGGNVVWLKDSGELVGLGRDTLLELSTKYIVTKQLVPEPAPAQAGGDRWRVEYQLYVPDELTLRAVLMGEGGLARRLPKAPSEPRKLSPQKLREVRERLKTGEPSALLAAEYNVELDTIKQLAAQ